MDALHCAVIWLVAGPSFVMGQIAGQEVPEYHPVVSTLRSFRIPYVAGAGGVEEKREKYYLLLVVSKDRGSSWEPAGIAVPGIGQFEFSTPINGEYWFSAVLIDLETDQPQEKPGSSVMLRVVVRYRSERNKPDTP